MTTNKIIFLFTENELPTTPPPDTSPPATQTTTTAQPVITTQPVTTTQLVTTAQPVTTTQPVTTAQPVTTTETAPTTAPDSTNEPTTQPDPVSISVSITASGTNTAGKNYNLECSATGSTDKPTITWLDPMNNTVPSEMVTTTGSMSTLTFNSLAASHAGTYTCRGVVGGVTETQTSTVIVNGMSDL